MGNETFYDKNFFMIGINFDHFETVVFSTAKLIFNI